jgi:hypothetical protein
VTPIWNNARIEVITMSAQSVSRPPVARDGDS